MKSSKIVYLFIVLLVAFSCGRSSNRVKQTAGDAAEADKTVIPIDKGFSDYITGYTSGIIPVTGSVEIRFTTDFASPANKKKLSGLFEFDPPLKGKAEWKDDITLVFIPSKILEPGKTYTGKLNLYKFSDPKERLRVFPLRLQTLKKDFQVSVQGLQCSSAEATAYDLNGEIIASDYIDPSETESYLSAKLNDRKVNLTWDHTSAVNIHSFSIKGIARTDKKQELILNWDGAPGGVKQKGSSMVNIPPLNEFRVLSVSVMPGEGQRIDIVLSEPVNSGQETDGLIWFIPNVNSTVQINSNTISVFPSVRLQGSYKFNIEASLKSSKGEQLSSPYNTELEFGSINPGIKLSGKGVILPLSENLIFPFTAVNLKAVDLKIVKIFENNLPYFLQNNDLNGRWSIRYFGRQVYSGRVDLAGSTSTNTGTWSIYSIDLADYIKVEPGILYKVELSMRPSYSLYPCFDNSSENDKNKYEDALLQAQQRQMDYWDNTDNYYEDSESSIFYRFRTRWQDRENPCKLAFYSPDKTVTRSLLASNLGLIAKMGEDKNLHVYVTDLRNAQAMSEVSVESYDLQMQLISSGKTDQNGSVSLACARKPFIVIARKDNDRNYLKTNDGTSLSLSSFDVSGMKPENGIKAFIYGERDVWRPGDSIYLSVLIKDLKNSIPAGHPVQFELINPLDQRVDNQVQNAGSNLLVFATKTGDDAVTGNYNAVFRIGGATFIKRVRIETVKPNRLKIELSFPDEILGGESNKLSGNLSAKWMNGALAKNLKVAVDLIFRTTKTTFNKFSQYEFDDPASSFSSETIRALDGTIDEKGEAKIDFQPGKVMNAPGMLNAVFTARVFEKGGDASIIQKSFKYAPYPVFTGLNLPGLKGKSRMLYTDAENELKILTVNEKGIPVSSDVEITLYKISYRWWWESADENLGIYISNQRYKPVMTKKITTAGGEASFKFNINKNEWGRYYIKATAASGHSTGKIVLIDWPWEYGMKANTSAATLLTINTDKDKYNTGDNIRLSFPAPENARAIITIENSTGVLDEMRVNTSGANTEVNFRAKPEMAPNVYAYVTVIQPHSQTVNDMPVRLYGIVPVMVEDPSTRISPQISMADELRSEKPFEIRINEAAGKEMTYTLAVVDEGLLDITGYKTPDPWSYFYAREALGVKTWDLYDYVLGAFGGTLDRIFATGGDGTLADKSANKAKRFNPVVKFLGPFNLGSGKTNTHRIILPQYTGSVKTMVVAGSERSYGVAEKSSFVRDPLMVLATAPRVLSPGEKVTLPVTLFVQKEGIKEIKVEIESNELISFSEKSRTVKITGLEEKDLEFAFTTAERLGKATIKVLCSGGGEKASYNLEIEVRSPNPAETRSEIKVLNPGEKWTSQFTPFGAEGTNSASVEFSRMPSINLEKRLDYLIQYPHGCSEQITSAAFPQLWLKSLIGDYASVNAKTAENVTSAIQKIVSRQMINGGIALWPEASQPDGWVTSYAGHFMLEAEKMGYSIPSGFRQKWIGYQKKTAQDWRYDPLFRQSANDQAYRLFTLALAGQPEKGAMNRLRESKDAPSLSKWLLAAAFATSGRDEVAWELINTGDISTERDYWDYYYGSFLRDKSVILYTLTILKKEEKALMVLKEICDNLNNDSWYSTQTLAWGLFSYMKFAELVPGNKGAPAKVIVSLNGDKTELAVPEKQITRKDLKIKTSENTFLVQNTSQNPVYATLIRKGVPLRTDVTREEKGLSMKVDYLGTDLKPIDHKDLEQGTDFLMVVKVTNNTLRMVDNIALTEMVPSGWEIRNSRMYESELGLKENTYDYRDFRDDRVFTYFRLDRSQTKTFILVLNAAYKGDYYQPAVWCEAMYTEGCYSRIPGVEVKVSGQGN